MSVTTRSDQRSRDVKTREHHQGTSQMGRVIKTIVAIESGILQGRINQHITDEITLTLIFPSTTNTSRFDGRLEDAILFLKANTNDCRYLAKTF